MVCYKKCHLSAIVVLIFAVLGCNLFSSTENESKEIVVETPQEEIVFGDDSHSDTTTLNDFEIEEANTAEEQKQSGNKRKVVRFAKNKTSRTYRDLVYNKSKHTYILEAAKGQDISVKLGSVESNAIFSIRKPKGGFIFGSSNRKAAGPYNGTLPASGKYQIEVSPTFGNSSYNITFSVTGKTKDNSATVESVGGLTTVVRFKKGATSANYRNAVVRGQRNTYILGGKGGQLMSVSISSLEDNAVFGIKTPGGKTIVSGKSNWSGQLPADGKYRIIVRGMRGNATYTVRFAVR